MPARSFLPMPARCLARLARLARSATATGLAGLVLALAIPAPQALLHAPLRFGAVHDAFAAQGMRRPGQAAEEASRQALQAKLAEQAATNAAGHAPGSAGAQGVSEATARLCVQAGSASPQALEALIRAGAVGPKTNAGIIGASGIECGEMAVRPFETSHDTPQSCGYRITLSDGRTVSLFTDLGTVTEPVREGLRDCDFAILESNHDLTLLKTGPYPYPLKQRILSQRGHLSNDDCASEIAELAKRGTARFLLAHLSRENNTPRIAFDTSSAALSALSMRRGVDYELYVAPVYNEEGRSILF